MKKIRVAFFGMAHVHVGTLYKNLAAYHDEVELVGYAETPPVHPEIEKERLAALGAGANAMPRYEDWRALAEETIDLAVVCSDNAGKAEVACELLERGVAVAIEKPLAHTAADARRMLEASRRTGALLAVNWPIAWFPAFNRAKALCDEGVIGKIHRVTYRSPATWGPYSYSPSGENPPIEYLGKTWWYQKERGGGSVLDYAGYGTVLTTWFFGHPPVSAQGFTKNFDLPGLDVEDYSAFLYDFGEGIGLLEGSWSTYNPGEVPSGPVIHGEKGCIVCDRHSSKIKVYLQRSHGPIPPTQELDCPAAEENFNFGRNILDAVKGIAPLHPILEGEFNLAVMAALDAAREAAQKGGAPVSVS